jgi:5-formyltetrahydrofolate cyclo-ligase
MISKKTSIRRNMIKKRNAMCSEEALEKSNQIKKRINVLDYFRNSKNILFYVSYGNEVHTHDLIKESIILGKTVFVPTSVPYNKSLIISELKNWNDLEISTYNILEPKQESIKKFHLDSIELIFVPGVAFDCYGNRIGHGKGYYDRLLHDNRNIPHIGLAFELQIIDIIPTEPHDLPVDIIITEKRIINCQSFS